MTADQAAAPGLPPPAAATHPAGAWPRGVPREATMTIGQLLERLKSEFPEITVSKLRFLENEGLITPQRTGSGYRKYSAADVVRFRYILAAQRERFWPLRVIGEKLAQLDAGHEGQAPQLEAFSLGPAPVARAEGRLGAAELAALAGTSESFIEELNRLAMLTADRAGRFASSDAAIVRLVTSLAPYGIEPRHLRALATAVQREAALIGQAIEPVARSGRDGAREAAVARAAEMAGIVSSIHAALLRRAVGEEG